MKILHIINRVPYPPKDGGAILYYNFIKSAQLLGHSITQLCMNTSRHHVDTNKLPEDYTKLAEMHFVDINNDIHPLKALKNLFSKQSYHIERFNSAAFENKLIDLLSKQTFDIIQLDSLFVCSYIDVIKRYSKAKIVLRAHNVEHIIWKRIAQAEYNPLKKWYLLLLSKRLKKFELEAINKVDLLLPITEIDKILFQKLGCTTPQYITPAGIDIKNFIIKHSQSEIHSLFHLGSLDWIPNQQGIKWFITHVWPLIHQEYKELKFYIAGRNTPEWLYKIKIPNIIIIGEVENAADFINSKSIMIVPLLSGSGMRLKILEGMALEKIIISTSIGAEGIHCTDNKHLLIANSPSDFLNQIRFCIENPSKISEIQKKARNLIEHEYDNFQIIKNLLNHYHQIIKS